MASFFPTAAANLIEFMSFLCNDMRKIGSVALRMVVVICMIISVAVFAEKVIVGIVSLYAKVFQHRPDKVYKWQPIKEDDEIGSLAYPMVLVQIPIYNEKEVYQLSIGAACRLKWPSDRLIIQVLDDSTDFFIKDLVKEECENWSGNGLQIKYEARKVRSGYKAGNLRERMKHRYVQTCEYVAIFDADFQPEPDFLIRTVPYLMQNSKIGIAQARWKFVNADASFLTRMQEISMDYHFKVEQEAGSTLCAFFGFNESWLHDISI